jgi:hypothetical protein
MLWKQKAKNGFKILLIMSLGFICLLSILVLFIGWFEKNDAFYVNYGEAKQAGAIGQQRIIPGIIPDSSYEIYSRFNIDSNQTWIKLKANKDDLKELLQKLEKVKYTEIEKINFPRSYFVNWLPNWWPRDLNKDFFTMKNPQQTNLEIYRHHRIFILGDNNKNTVPSFWVIDWDSNIVYFWQNGF